MRRTFAATLLLATSALAYADSLEIGSNVQRVDLYPDGLVIGRSAAIDLPVGQHELILSGLPMSWEPETLGFRLQGEEAVTIRSYSVDMTATDGDIAQQIEALKGQIEDLANQLQALRQSKATHQAESALVEQFLKDPSLFAERTDIASFWIYLIERHEALSQSLNDSNAEMEDLEDQQSELRDQINDLKSQEFEAQIRALVNVAASGTYQIDASYFSRSAGWSPSYTLDLETSETAAEGKVQITQQADMWQSTGEDWVGADAKLHSVFASTFLSPPMGHPFVLNAYGDKRWSSVSGGAAGGGAGGGAGAYEADFSIFGDTLGIDQHRWAAEVSGIYASSYTLPHSLALTSDGHARPQTKILEAAEAKADLWVQAVAEQDARGMLMAGFNGPLTGATLPGEARVFRNGAFIGQTYLDAVQPDEALELAFGFDALSTITRTVIHDQEGDKGFIGRLAYLDRSIETLVSNSHAFTMPFRLIEAQPVSRHEDIEVEILRGSDTFDLIDLKGQGGVNAWAIDLAANEQSKRVLTYRVKWPESMYVEGL